ncbi:hypothetical protein ACFROC_05655 [Nocardia tengchongensis]|uniref:hypothetical protein n=1 Tax=Nocardia tengchongensis TaxID=2055889 RepID=UPI0036CA788A
MFLDIGASVNSLTQSDHGLDLHVQLPEIPMVLAGHTATVPAPPAWELSWRSLHVQIKYTKKPPSLGPRLASGWASAVRAGGTPTFLVWLVPASTAPHNGGSVRARIVLPQQWHRWGAGQEATTPTKVPDTMFSAPVDLDDLDGLRRLAHVADLWTRYPVLLSTGGFDPTASMLAGTLPDPNSLEAFSIDVATAAIIAADMRYEPIDRWQRIVTECVSTAYALVFPAMGEQRILDRIGAAHQMVGMFTSPDGRFIGPDPAVAVEEPGPVVIADICASIAAAVGDERRSTTCCSSSVTRRCSASMSVGAPSPDSCHACSPRSSESLCSS